MIMPGSRIIAAAGLFVIWRERQSAGGTQARAGRVADRSGLENQDGPKALKVMMVRVSAIPGIGCTFSAMKWPISVPGST